MQSKQYFTKIKNYPHEKSTKPKTWQELTVFRQLKQCRRMKKQKHTRMPFFAFHFTSGDYSGEIYTTGPPGIFRPQTAITVYFCQVSKYVIGAYNV